MIHPLNPERITPSRFDSPANLNMNQINLPNLFDSVLIPSANQTNRRHCFDSPAKLPTNQNKKAIPTGIASDPHTIILFPSSKQSAQSPQPPHAPHSFPSHDPLPPSPGPWHFP